MTARSLLSGFRAVHRWRFAALLLAALAAGLICDRLRNERVVFPAPLPVFTTLPADR